MVTVYSQCKVFIHCFSPRCYYNNSGNRTRSDNDKELNSIPIQLLYTIYIYSTICYYL